MTLVMLYHATFISTIVHPELGPRTFVFPYQAGASLLLTISAYFACATLGRGGLLRYCVRRMARLLPSFVAAVVVIFLVLQLFPAPGWFDPTPGDLVANLLMLWNWAPETFPFIDASHWTLPLQLMATVVVAALYHSRWGRGRRVPVVLWAAVLVPMLQWPLRASNPPEWYAALADGFGLHRWHMFVAGAAIWLWSTRRLRTGHFLALLMVCLAAQALHTSTLTRHGLIVNWGFVVPVAIGLGLIALTARGPDWVVPAWARTAIHWYAGISYGVFLMHQSLGYLVQRWLHEAGLDGDVQTVGMIATGIILGWLLTRFVEQPAFRLLTDRFDRRRASIVDLRSELHPS